MLLIRIEGVSVIRSAPTLLAVIPIWTAFTNLDGLKCVREHVGVAVVQVGRVDVGCVTVDCNLINACVVRRGSGRCELGVEPVTVGHTPLHDHVTPEGLGQVEDDHIVDRCVESVERSADRADSDGVDGQVAAMRLSECRRRS